MNDTGRRVVCLLAGVVAMLGVAGVKSEDSPSWQVVGVQGLVQVVIVPKEQAKDFSAYKLQLARLCPPERTCFVNFYENTLGVKGELPLPDAIANQPAARFRRSMKNGAELFQWSCRVAENSNDAQCF
ncbi:MAG TPA: hypothetical protein VLA61_13250 [Ideonella sp.]|uniref:hypothetical protein n=1 Tax=Ideonella sp. TaxID=1929293 RepID=UPI002BC1C8D2|nr:hypothetical protein [Ideonella sp.]HSI49233.1 hypothetical protein [Ideonella sp.]